MTRPLRVEWVGTYERDYPRTRVLVEGLRAHGVEVTEHHRPVWERTRHKAGGFLSPRGLAGAGLTHAGAWAGLVLDEVRHRGPVSVPKVPSVRRGGERVLVADDQETVRTAARAILERSGYTVVLARDGSEAMELFSADPAAFDCALLDLTMPGMSGAEVYAALRRARPSLPILLTSGYNEHEVTELLGEGSNAEFLQKPGRASALLAKLGAMLGRQDDGG